MWVNSYGRRRVEDHLERVDVRRPAVGPDVEALRLVHPGVGGDHRERPHHAGDHDRHAGPEVPPALEPLPAVDVDRDEDRLGEEEDALERERDPERVAEAVHELGPEQAHLEREDRAGHGADGEGDGDDLRPAAGEQHRVGVAVLAAPVLGDQHDRGERHPEARQDDVESQRERHLVARGQQVGRRVGQQRRQVRHGLSLRPDRAVSGY